jgi:hypothetical protein
MPQESSATARRRTRIITAIQDAALKVLFSANRYRDLVTVDAPAFIRLAEEIYRLMDFEREEQSM